MTADQKTAFAVTFLAFVRIALCTQNFSDGDLRLTGGLSPGEGRLEVYYFNTWGAVCDDGFGDAEAGVACWQLGYGRHGNNFSTLGPEASNPVMLLDDLHCAGAEERLADCAHKDWGNSDCKDVEHVGLTCRAAPCRAEPCFYGATCIEKDEENVTCVCSPVTWGDRCQHFVDFCATNNGGCSHQCASHNGSYNCACPDEGLLLGADGHTCRAPSLHVTCGNVMSVAMAHADWPGLQQRYLAAEDPACVASGNRTHITMDIPLDGCGTRMLRKNDGFVFENRVMTRQEAVGGLVTRVRDVNMTVRCHYADTLALGNWYIVDSGEIAFTDVAKGHYQLTMDLFHNGHQYVGQSTGKVEPGENLSLKFSLNTNDSSLQVFARSCSAKPANGGGTTAQYLFLDDGCNKDPHLNTSSTDQTKETLELQAFQFLQDNATDVIVHCDVIVCNVTDPGNRCTKGCLTGNDKRNDADDEADKVDDIEGGSVLSKIVSWIF